MINHIGFIMDGNRRYAEKYNISLKKAYKQGMEQFLNVVEYQMKKGIKHTSFFALSSHNYEKRKKSELKPIFDLIEEFFKKNSIEQFFLENNIKISIKGNTKQLEEQEKSLEKQYSNFITSLEERLKKLNEKIKNPQYFVHIALNYDGQEELVEAFKKIQKGNEKEITTTTIKNNLYFYDVPSPEIIVRFGDAPRISGFLLFDSAYSEIYLSKKLWGEVTTYDLDEIINWFSKLSRNFGR